MPDFSHPGVVAAFAVYLPGVVLGLWLGGWPERRVASTVLAMIVTQLSLNAVFGRPIFHTIDGVALLVDFLGFAALFAIAMEAHRLWTLFAAMFQLISLSSHFSRVFDVLPMTYMQMKGVPTLIVVVLLVIGVIHHRIYLHAHGERRDRTPWEELAVLRRFIKSSR